MVTIHQGHMHTVATPQVHATDASPAGELISVVLGEELATPSADVRHSLHAKAAWGLGLLLARPAGQGKEEARAPLQSDKAVQVKGWVFDAPRQLTVESLKSS